jgi:hypothetical protein
MQDLSHDGPQFSRGVSNINAKCGIVNQVGRNQYNQHYNNYNNVMNDEMVVHQSYQRINLIIV